MTLHLSIEFERDYVIIGGDIYASFLYIVDLPTSLSRPMWRQLLNFPGAVYVSMHCDVIPPHEAAVMLRRESNAIFTKQIFRAYNRQRTDVVDSSAHSVLTQHVSKPSSVASH